jgi:hypothetical protein
VLLPAGFILARDEAVKESVKGREVSIRAEKWTLDVRTTVQCVYGGKCMLCCRDLLCCFLVSRMMSSYSSLRCQVSVNARRLVQRVGCIRKNEQDACFLHGKRWRKETTPDSDSVLRWPSFCRARSAWRSGKRSPLAKCRALTQVHQRDYRQIDDSQYLCTIGRLA